MKQKIYKVLSVLLTLALVFSTCICSVSADEVAEEPSGPKEITYYVSPNGDDAANGLEATTPVATVDKAVNLALAAGYVKGDTVYVKVIHVADKVNVWTTASSNKITAHEFTLDVSSYADKAQIGAAGVPTHFNGPVVASNIVFGWGTTSYPVVNCGGNDIVFGEGVSVAPGNYNLMYAKGGTYDTDRNLTLKTVFSRPIYIGGDWGGCTFNANINITVDAAGAHQFVIGSNNGNGAVHAAKINGAVNINIKKATSFKLTVQNNANKLAFGENSAVQIINSIGADAAAWKTPLSSNSTAGCKPTKYYIINNKLGKANAVAFTGTVGKYNVKPSRGYVASVKNEAGEVVATGKTGEIDLSALPSGIYTIEPAAYEAKTITYYVSANGNDEADGKTPETAVATVDKAVNLANAAGYGESDIVYVKLIHVANKAIVWTTAKDNRISPHKFTLDISSQGAKAKISDGAPTQFNGPAVLSNIEFGWSGWKAVDFGGNDIVIGEGVTTTVVEFDAVYAKNAQVYDDDCNLTINNALRRNMFIGGDYCAPVFNGNINLTLDGGGNHMVTIGSCHQNGEGIQHTTINGAVNINVKSASNLVLTIPNDSKLLQFGANSAVQIINSAGIFPAVWNTNLSANTDPLCKPSKYYIVNNNVGLSSAVSFTDTVGKFKVAVKEGFNITVTNANEKPVEAKFENGIVDLTALPSGIYNIDLLKAVPEEITLYVSPEGDDEADGKTPETALASVDTAVIVAMEAGIVKGDTVYVKAINVPEKYIVWTTASSKKLTAHKFLLDISSHGEIAQINDAGNMNFAGPTRLSNIKLGVGDWKDSDFGGNDIIIGEGVTSTSPNFNIHHALATGSYDDDYDIIMNAPLPKNLWIGGSWTKPVYNGKINLTVDGKGIFDITIGSNQGNNATGSHAVNINGELNINLKSASAVSLSFQTDPAKIRFGEKAVVQIINSVGAYSETWDTVLKTLQFKPASYYIINNKTKKDISVTEYPGEYAFEFDESIQKLVVENADGNEVTYSEGILILPDSGTYTLSLECIKHTYSNDCDDVCDVCEEVDENRGHLFTNYVSNNDATCTEDGTKTATCDREGCEEKDTIADPESMLDHLYDNDCDAKCNVCEAEREVGDHKYSSATDPDCDNCGAKRQLGNQFVKEADGKYHYYNNGVHSKVTDLVKINGKWHYLEEGVWANTVDTLHKINGKWFLIKKGIWTATTGLTEYKGKTFYVVGGKWNSDVNDLKKINGKWYFIKSGKWDSSLESLHKLNGKWFLVKGGMWKATTGLVKYQGKQFYVVGGKWESRTGVYKISGKNYFIKGGKWDKTITTLYKKSGKLLSIKNGMWTKSKAIIKYSGKKYFCDDGYAQTKKTGKVKVSGKTYTVKKGIVK